MAVDQELIEMLRPLWQLPRADYEDPKMDPKFNALTAYCKTHYGAEDPAWAIRNALVSLGQPSGLQPRHKDLATDLPTAARELDAAFRQTIARRRHLCPLDCADDLPRLTFGRSRVGHFPAEELAVLLDMPRLTRNHQNAPPDLDNLKQFHWLIVDEDIEVDPRPAARATPIFYADFGEDFGRIDPHAGAVPSAVENALFFLLLAPWEDWSSHRTYDWRAFRVPWVYTTDDDLFVHPKYPPSSSTLSWDPDIYQDRWGDMVESERPSTIRLDDVDASEIEQLHSEAAWQRLQTALVGPLFETPIIHFLTRGFLSRGVDEVLAHLTSIEAALGHKQDYNRKTRPSGLSASDVVTMRVRGLLADVTAGNQYATLFDWRSEYLHGRGEMSPLPSEQRLQARSLARRVAAALVEYASASTGSRREFLDALLQKGLSLHGTAGPPAT